MHSEVVELNVMTASTLIESPLWKQFEDEAQRQGEDPVALVAKYLNESLEIWEDEALDEEIAQDARRSGYREEDAVEIVQQYRREKKDPRVAP
jgi:hypothetical protein